MAPPEVQDLARMPLLAGASAGQISSLAALMEARRAPAGTILGRQGEVGSDFWLVLNGRLEVTVASPGEGERVIASASSGAILGELALLRHQERTATVTAVDDCSYASGGPAALEELLAIEAAHERIRRLASRRLAEDLSALPVTLPDGTAVLVRPLLPQDREALGEAVRALSRQSLRRRFFSEAPPSPALLDYLADIDYVDHFAWAVIDPSDGGGVATARYIRRPEHGDAEVAFTIADRFQGRGMGTFLLGALAVAATEAGVERLVAYTMEENRAMRAVFAKAGGRASYDEPGVLLVSVGAARAVELVPEPLRDRIRTSVHDIVTAASLALAGGP